VNRVAGIVSTPSLFGLLDASEELDDTPLEVLEKRSKEKPPATSDLDTDLEERLVVSAPKNITYVDHQDLSTFAVDASGAQHIRRLSPNAWVGCGNDIYVLDCMGKGHLRVEPIKRTASIKSGSQAESPRFRGLYMPASMRSFERSQRILAIGTLAEVVKGCDVYVKKIIPNPSLSRGVRHSAKWRRTEITKNQRTFLRKHLGKSGELVVPGGPENDFEMSKGEAADLISRIIHGVLVCPYADVSPPSIDNMRTGSGTKEGKS